MKLKQKIIIILILVIALSLTLSSLLSCYVAQKRLIHSAQESLEDKADLIESRIRLRFELLTKRVQAWSVSPYVLEVVQDPDNQQNVSRLNQVFEDFVKSDSILQTVNLLDKTADCIASSIPERIGLEEMKEIVGQREDFLMAMYNQTAVKGAFVAISSGRPIVAISVPVTIRGKVEAVLRLIVDVQWFGNFLSSPPESGSKDEVFVFSPRLDLNKYAGHDFTLVIQAPYKKPDIPDVIPGFESGRGIVNYTRDGLPRMAAFRWMDSPRWVIVVDRPMAQILEPIKDIRYTVVFIAVLLFVFVGLFAGMTVRPLLSGINECLNMVRRFGDGDYSARTAKVSSLDIAELAGGLNSMARQIEVQNESLKVSEARYKNIFETAAEGIFQTDQKGCFIAANPALLRILEAKGFDELRNIRANDFYLNPEDRTKALKILSEKGRLDNFEFRLKTLKCRIRECRINVAESVDVCGNAKLFLGIMSDITVEKQAGKDREKVRKAEKLALEARFKALRFQLNPHFLFNVLNTIDVLARRSPEKIGDLIRKLSRHLRHTLSPGSEMFQPLHMELKTVRSYLAVEEVRFQEQLNVEMEINPQAENIPVPDLVLQPLVENALKYGRMTSPDILRLMIKADLNEKRLIITVSNTGHLVEKPENSTGLGLGNLRERLSLVYGYDFCFELIQDEIYVRAELDLPVSGR